ncbi:MAG: ComEC/Rec2 family competence protein, partial [Planctomycetota bacterium]
MPAVLVATTDRGSVRYHPLVLALAAASGGMVIDRVWQPPLWFFWFAAPLALGGWLTLWLCRRDRVASGVLLLAAAAVAAGWHHCAWHLFGRDEIGLFAGTQAQPVALRARVCRAPRRIPSPPKSPLQVFGDDERWRLELAVSALRDRDCWRNASGRVLLTVTGPMSALRAGDQVQVFAQMETPPAAANPGEFEYARFLRGDRVLALLSTEAGACVERLADGTRLSLARTLEGARRRANDLLGRLLNPHNARLAAVLLLGEREEFEAERSDAFLRTGTIHLLSISGLHVGILAIFATQLLRRLPIPAGWSMAAVAALIVAYMLLVDARAPVVRATVLVVAAALGVAIGRPRLSLNLLAGAALVVLAWNPTDLFRVGPQLSFLAAAVLMWFGPRLVQREVTSDPLARFVDHYRSAWEKACRRQLWAARQVTLLGAVVWSITLPLVLARFHVFSPAALVLNTILWIPVGVALTFGFMAVGLSAIWLPLGMPCGWVCDLSLWIIEAVVDRTASLPGSHGWLPGPADWWLFGFYGGLAAVLAVPRLPLPLRWRVAILAVWVGCGFA